MDDLAAFIAARLDEDENLAAAATGPWSGRWYADSDGNVQDEKTDQGVSGYIASGHWPDSGMSEADAAHIARHDPARVLREVTAKRAILARHHPLPGVPVLCEQCIGDRSSEWWPCEDVRAIAAIWSDHPDYRAEWAPGEAS